MKSCFLFFLSIFLSGRSGCTPETAISVVTCVKSNAKALLTAGAYQKFPCALPGAEKARAHYPSSGIGRTYTPRRRHSVFRADPGSCRRGKIRDLGFSPLVGKTADVYTAALLAKDE